MINASGTVIGSTSMANSGKSELLTSLSMFTNNVSNMWILDSGATDHMTPLTDVFESYEEIAPGKHVQSAHGTLLPVVGIGKLNILHVGQISNVVHVPKVFVLDYQRPIVYLYVNIWSIVSKWTRYLYMTVGAPTVIFFL